MLRLGKGVKRKEVSRAFVESRPTSFVYDDVLEAEEIREAVAGIRDAGTPELAEPLLAWLATHPHTPEDIMRDMARTGTREVLLSLALNRALPEDLKKVLLEHPDEEVRLHANHVFSRLRRH